MKKWSEEAYEALGGRGVPSPETLLRVTALARRCERRGYVLGCVVGIVSSIVAALLLSCGPNQLHDAREFVGPGQDCIARGDGWQLSWASEPGDPAPGKVRVGPCTFLPERVRRALGGGDDPTCIHIGPDTCTVQWDRRADGSCDAVDAFAVRLSE